MDDKPLVSVILATYNGKKNWLKKAIDSVYAQTYQNFEFIIINDCSTNNIYDIIKGYMRNNKIKYIKNDKNLGLTKSLNIGIKNSHGKYIARIDDDDYWISKDKLEKQVEFMENNPEYGLCGAGTIVRIDENDKILFTEYKNRLSDNEIRKDMLLQCWITHSSVMIRRKAIDEVGMYNQKYIKAQDYELWLRIGTKYKLINLKDISIAYRVRPNSLSKSEKNRMFKAIFSEMVRKNRKNYPGFIKATILKIGVFIIGRNTSLSIWRKINPNLAVYQNKDNRAKEITTTSKEKIFLLKRGNHLTSKKNPLVSVILSTYNGKKTWLKKAIDSIYAQTYQNFELVIINDCSTNDIENTIVEYKKKYDNIIYIKNKKNLGLTKSLNVGIKNSHGKYIARIDDDDYWISKNKLEKQVEFMENNPEYGLCGAGTIVHIDENDKILFTEYKNRLSDNEIRKHILQQNQIIHIGVLIRKSCLNDVGYYNIEFKVAQDYELWLRIGTKYKLINLKEVTIAYRNNSSGISNVKSKEQRIASFKIFRLYHKKYPNSCQSIILRVGYRIIPKKIRQLILKKINPNGFIVHNNNNKNILVLNYEFPPIGGGAAPVSYDISKGYVDTGYNVDVITMGYNNLPSYENVGGINIYRVKCIKTKKEVCHPREQVTYLISGYFKAKKLLRQKKYNVCHCHFLVPTGILALILKKIFGLKYFVTSHGSDVPGYNPDRFTFLHKFTPPLLKKIINNSESIVTPSKYLADLIRKNIIGINKNIEIIPNGIDTNEFIPLKKEKIIIGTGRLRPLKGLHLLTKAFSEIANTNGFELHICGDGPLMDKIKGIQRNSKNKIILHGWMNNKSKKYTTLLGKSTIYCLPSTSESGSLSILEGMSCESAIVTTKMGVCGEMVKDIGFYVEPTVKSIKEQLEILIKNSEICIESGKKARIKATNNYDKNITVGKYIKLCEKYL